MDLAASPIMKLLILNAHSAQNAGDLAILRESIACLRRAFPNADLTITMNDELSDLLPDDAQYVGSFMRWMMQVDQRGEWRWRKQLVPVYGLLLILASLSYRLFGLRLLPWRSERRALMRAYYAADVVAVIGGGHLYARHALNIAFLWLWLGIALALLMGKPLIFLPQSFGPLPGRLQQGLLRWLLSRSALLVAREYRSLRLLAEIGLRRRALVLPDLAFGDDMSERLLPVPGLAEIAATQQPLVGLTLMDWQGQNPGFRNQSSYEAAILALMRHLRERYNARVLLFAQCTGPTAAHDDRLIARRLAAEASAQGIDAVDLIDAALSPEQLKAAYERLDLLVATRMHSAIFALSRNVPVLAIGYLYKSVGIMEMLGLERYALDIDTIDATALCAASDALWAERDRIRQLLSARIPAMQHTLAYLPTLIRGSIERP
jgi:colanic acid/amylovoran biosynthesis protein